MQPALNREQTMPSLYTPTTLRLERGQTTRLTDGRAAHLVSTAGTLWITIDHDPRDIVLEAGDAIDLLGGASVLVSTLGGPAELALTPSALEEPVSVL
jgi:hypothetical protein